MIQVDKRFEVGDLATPVGPEIEVAVTILGPSWIDASLVELFANGIKIREQSLSPARPPSVTKAKLTWTIPLPSQDVHLVCRTTGPAVTNLYWAIPRPYQPRSTLWKPQVMGCTNPIWVDSDGDGKFTSARAYAERLTKTLTPRQLIDQLASYDEPTSAHAADLLRIRDVEIDSPSFSVLLQTAAPQVRRGFAKVAQPGNQ